MAEKKSVWLTYSDEEKSKLEQVNAGYIDFISNCKTERESVKEAIISIFKVFFVVVQRCIWVTKSITTS